MTPTIKMNLTQYMIKTSEDISFDEFCVFYAEDLQLEYINTGAYHEFRNKEVWLRWEYEKYVSGKY